MWATVKKLRLMLQIKHVKNADSYEQGYCYLNLRLIGEHFEMKLFRIRVSFSFV